MSESFWDKSPIAIAHRGGDAAGEDTDNTLAAFKAAQKAGYTYGETDVILAASGEIVTLHGSRNLLHSYVGGEFSRGMLQSMTLKQIRIEMRPGGYKVPTLEEILTGLPKMRFFIDPKTDEVVFPLAKLIKKLSAQDRVCVGSFHHERLQTLNNLLKTDKIPTSLIVGRGLRLRNKNMNMLKTGRLKGLEAIQLHHSLVSREMLDLVHSHGFRAVIWTANSPLSIKNAQNCGADGIISDNITLLKELLGK